MSETRLSTLGKILAFAALVEIGTGLALLIDPAIVTIRVGARAGR